MVGLMFSFDLTLSWFLVVALRVQCKDLRGNPKPQVSLDGNWSGVGEHYGWVRSGNIISDIHVLSVV